jgi:hypothetical protein
MRDSTYSCRLREKEKKKSPVKTQASRGQSVGGGSVDYTLVVSKVAHAAAGRSKLRDPEMYGEPERMKE